MKLEKKLKYLGIYLAIGFIIISGNWLSVRDSFDFFFIGDFWLSVLTWPVALVRYLL